MSEGDVTREEDLREATLAALKVDREGMSQWMEEASRK